MDQTLNRLFFKVKRINYHKLPNFRSNVRLKRPLIVRYTRKLPSILNLRQITMDQNSNWWPWRAHFDKLILTNSFNHLDEFLTQNGHFLTKILQSHKWWFWFTVRSINYVRSIIYKITALSQSCQFWVEIDPFASKDKYWGNIMQNRILTQGGYFSPRMDLLVRPEFPEEWRNLLVDWSMWE